MVHSFQTVCSNPPKQKNNFKPDLNELLKCPSIPTENEKVGNNPRKEFSFLKENGKDFKIDFSVKSEEPTKKSGFLSREECGFVSSISPLPYKAHPQIEGKSECRPEKVDRFPVLTILNQISESTAKTMREIIGLKEEDYVHPRMILSRYLTLYITELEAKMGQLGRNPNC